MLIFFVTQIFIDPFYYVFKRSTGTASNSLKPWFLESTDHDPEFMLEVFKHPKDYLSGPSSNVDNSVPQKHFVIIGAGIAGLSSAYMLLDVGHKVRNKNFQNESSF